MREGWRTERFDNVFELQMGKTPSRNNPAYFNGDNVWVSIADLKGKYINDSKEYISDEAISDTGIAVVPANTVIMSFKLSVGKCAITTKELYTNEAIMSFRPKVDYSLIPDFIYYFLKGYHWQGANKAVMGITLNKKSISNNIFSFPPLPTQQQIVEELDLLSGIIEKQKAQLKELDCLAQSLFYDMFGDPVTNEKGWEVKKLGESVSEMFLGPFGSSLKVDCYVPQKDSYCMVYEQKHAIQKSIDLDNHYINEEKYNTLSRFRVEAGDFIMSCRGTIGKLYRLPKGAPFGIIHPSLMKIRIKESSYNPTYFSVMLPKIVANQNTYGNCVQMAITAKALGNLALGLPPLPLQQQFAERVASIEHQKSLVKQSLKETETLFYSRMDYYFN